MGRYNASNTPWTPEAVEYVRRRAAERWPAGRISDGLRDELGLVLSYNAVIGKANREGIALTAHVWPEQATEIVRRGSQNGLSAPQITKELQDNGFAFTRRNVRDKARFEKWPLAAHIRPKTIAAPPSPDLISSRASTQQKMNLREQRMKVVAEWVDHESDPLPCSRPTKLSQLKSHQCKWPLRRNEDGDRMFCGAFKLGDEKMPYCTHHHGIAIDPNYQPPRTKGFYRDHGTQTQTVI